MSQQIRYCLYALSAAALVACGGIGNDEALPSFAGAYSVNLTNTETSSCGDQGWPRNITLSQVVSQSGVNIILTTDQALLGETTFTGGLYSDSRGFTASHLQVVNVGDAAGNVRQVNAQSTMSYSTNTVQGIYSVKYDLNFGSCSYTYYGFANKK
jgi:hypothetical protein